MFEFTLKDILNGARHESQMMRHHYIGAEHLLIAMIESKGGLATSILHEYGLQPDFVVDALRRKLGKGGKQRAFPGTPQTPRASKIIEEARKLAASAGNSEPSERDILISILKDKDCLAVRVLVALGVKDLETLLYLAQTHLVRPKATRPFVAIEYGKEFDRERPLTNDELLVIRRLFDNYTYIRIDRHLTGGYSGALVLVVTPMTIDRREDAPVVVKIAHVDAIMDEAHRYETFVRFKLPPFTSRLEGKPVAPETCTLAGIRYTLVTDLDQTPRDLRSAFKTWNNQQFAKWLEGLFASFGRIWWQQRKPYRFQVWQEYDWMLPPLLTLELIKDDPPPTSTITLRIPIRRARLKGIEYGDIVSIENFLVQRIDPVRKTLWLAAGGGLEASRAYEIEIRGVDFENVTYYRGEVIENVTGAVWKTREELLSQSLRALEPDFDPDSETFLLNSMSPERLPNPIYAFESLLDRYINGTISTIHGDLHPGNIVLGPGDMAFLIDYAHTREGHTIFDWALLEATILSDPIMSKYGDSWEDARRALSDFMKLTDETLKETVVIPHDSPMGAVLAIRQTASQLLTKNNWAEYFTALTFCSLRAISWETLSIGGRRLMFLIAGLTIHELAGRLYTPAQLETPTPDDTNTML